MAKSVLTCCRWPSVKKPAHGPGMIHQTENSAKHRVPRPWDVANKKKFQIN